MCICHCQFILYLDVFDERKRTASERKRNLKSVRISYKNQSDVFPSLKKSVFMRKKRRKLTWKS